MDTIQVRRALLPKRGSRQLECEDAISVSPDRKRFAVVDGATEGIDSRRWARYLATAWSRRPGGVQDIDGLAECCRGVGDRLQARWRDRVVPWYVEEKARSGAFAAFVGVTLDDHGEWEAFAVGDCCLCAEGDGVEPLFFPVATPEDFRSRPYLVPSHHGQFADFSLRVHRVRGVLGPGSRLTLLSDAVAAWFLTGLIAGDGRTSALHAILDRDDAAAASELVATERGAGRMRNDDVAILRVSWPSDPPR